MLEAEPERIEVRTGTDGVVPYERVGRVELGDVGSLDVWWHAGYGGGIFVPVRDASSREGGYGGGRYLLDTAKGADLGTTAGPDGAPLLVVDLNFAYHPSCAYDPEWACPLAPPGNVLDVDVPVGRAVRGALGALTPRSRSPSVRAGAARARPVSALDQALLDQELAGDVRGLLPLAVDLGVQRGEVLGGERLGRARSAPRRSRGRRPPRC